MFFGVIFNTAIDMFDGGVIVQGVKRSIAVETAKSKSLGLFGHSAIIIPSNLTYFLPGFGCFFTSEV